jgi:hypothetical protein
MDGIPGPPPATTTADEPSAPVADLTSARVQRRKILDGSINEYSAAA